MRAIDVIQELKESNGKEEQNFSNITLLLDAKARAKGIPLSGQFELTPLCNFDCKMCYVHMHQDQLEDKKILPVETWKRIIYQAWQSGMVMASLTGGECLTYPGFDEIFLYLHELGCEVAILTNGFLLDEKRIQFFKEHKPSKIQITLYGCNNDVYERVTGRRAFDAVVTNAKNAVAAGLPVAVNLTPNRFLGEDALETLRICKSITNRVEVNSCIFSPREETGRSTHQDDSDTDLYIRIYRLLAELNGHVPKPIPMEELPPACGPDTECEKKGLRCGGGKSAFCVDWKGILTPCNRMDMIHADILAEGFSSAWKKINHEACNWPRVPECVGCAYEKICNNCIGNLLAYAEPGKLPTVICKQTMAFVSSGVKALQPCKE